MIVRSFNFTLFQQLHEHIFITIRKIHAFAIKSTRSFWISSKKFFDSHEHLLSFYLFTRRFFSDFVRASSIQFEIFEKNIRVCTSNRRVFFCFVQKIFQFFDFNSLVMNFIFLFLCDSRASNFSSLKSLFTYEERLASLKSCRKFLKTSRHFKAIMIVVDFSKCKNDSNVNVLQCIICSLLLYNEYFTFESLKKHFQNASHCFFVIQFQQNVDSKKVVKLKIVEKSKIEFSFALVSFVKFLNTYENKLSSLDIWLCVEFKNVMIVAKFNDIHVWIMTRCMKCSIKLFDLIEKSLKKHFQKSFHCSLVLQLEKKTSEIIVEIVKFTFVVANIDYFDSTLLCDIQEFNLFREIAKFLQQFRQNQHQYRESNLLTLLLECFRDSALIWYRQQNELEIEIVKQNLNEWLEVLITAFFTKSSKFEIFTSNSSVSRFSSQYHFCLNCFVFFSSLIRLLQHNQSICKKIVCKHCEKIFDSKNKFHEHIRQHHATKKMNKFVSKRNFNKERNKSTISIRTSTISSISSKTTTKFSIFKSVTFSEWSRNSSISFVTFATSKQIFWFRIIFASIISSKRSRFLLSTFKITSNRVKTTSTTCSFISFATFSSKFRKSISKFHFTIHDFHRMFVEKSKSFDLRQHQNRRFSSQNFENRQFDRSNFFYQFQIIAYFLFAINQKSSINQNLKSSNSKNFQQFTFAITIRSVLFEKSIFSSYKMTNIFYISLQSKFSFLQSKFSFAWFRFTFSFTFSLFFRFSFSDHVDCICFDHFNFRNDSFDYSWFNYRYFSNRRLLRKIWKK